MENEKLNYVSPEILMIDMETETAFCAASGNVWYESDGYGDFDYITDTENSWM